MVFGFLVIAAPLAFGAVDRITQIIVALVFSVGLMAWPPQVGRLSSTANRLIIGAALLLVFKDLAPAGLFGIPEWRTALTESYGVVLPPTHHPEPGRALDVWLEMVLAALWFLWVRTLASERDDRPVLAWSLFLAAAVMAAVAFMTRNIDPEAIYGLRITDGWYGFGPFPNRNHTASFLAMGLVLGSACIAWAGSHGRMGSVVIGVPLLALVLLALLQTHSRGGIVVLAVGMTIFLGSVLTKLRDPRTVGAAVGAALLIGTMTVVSGGDTLSRFSKTSESGEISRSGRQAIWKETVAMWQKAPLFGHGAGSFASLFPLHKRTDVGLFHAGHPESSWLQWLTELGLVAVLVGVVAVGIVVVPNLRVIFVRDATFFLRVAGLATFGGLLVHSCFDVPASRWGTAGFGLAALALACPRRTTGPSPIVARGVGYVPVAIAAFWVLPFLFEAPAWAPLQLKRVTNRELATGSVPRPELRRTLKYFPLNPTLHHLLGVRILQAGGDPAGWQRHFRIATRLMPTSWRMARTQARACIGVSPHVAVHYWQLAIERGEDRAGELFAEALRETAHLPNASGTWDSYVEAHPELALFYAQRLPGDQGRPFYDLWWRERALAPIALRPAELRDFYQQTARWGTPEQFGEWMRHRRELRRSDLRAWAALLHGWGDEEGAWRLLAPVISDPPFSDGVPKTPRTELESRFQIRPEDSVNARDLAQVMLQSGDRSGAAAIILQVADRPDAPLWFLRKGANMLAADGRFSEAVTLALRDTGG